MSIKEQVASFRDNYVSRVAKEKTLEEERDGLQADLDNINIQLLEKSQVVLQKLSEQQRREACTKLEGLCTFALQSSISPDYEAKIKIGTLRGKPAAQFFIFNTKTGVESTPMSSNGGGIVDIVSNALRYIIAEVWTDPVIDGPMISDEAYKHLSKEYTPIAAEFLKKTTDDFGRQTILSTHNDFIAQAADRRIEVTLDDNEISKIKIIDIGNEEN